MKVPDNCVTLIRIDERMEILDFDAPPTLEQLQSLVGGGIEIITDPNGDSQLIVDENGIAKCKSFNERASFIADQRIVGDVVYLHGDRRID